MVALFRFGTVILVLCIMPEVTPYRVKTPISEPYLQDEIEPYAPDIKYNHNSQVNSVINDNEDDNEMDLESVLKNNKYRLVKRNGDLINFLLGLPKDMLDAGR